VDVQVKQ